MSANRHTKLMQWCLALTLLIASHSMAIIGGDPTTAFPSVGKITGPSGGLGPEHVIGAGTLIERRQVLTAAHVVDGLLPSQISFVIEGVIHHVSSVRIHPDYNPDNGNHDLAILIFDEEILEATPSPLLRTAPTVGNALYLVGFGLTSTEPPDGDPSQDDNLLAGKHVGATILDELPGDGMWISWIHTEGEDDTAQFDGGGPAFVVIDTVLYVAGVHAKYTYRDAGATKVSSDVRVDSYVDWIDDPVGDTARVLVYRLAEHMVTVGQGERSMLTRRGYLVIDRVTKEVIAAITYRDPDTGLSAYAKEIWSLNANVSLESVSTRSSQIAHIALQKVDGGGRSYWYLFEGRVRDFFSFGPIAPIYSGKSIIIDEPHGNKIIGWGSYTIRLDRRRTELTAGFGASVVADQLGSEINTGLSLTLNSTLTRPEGSTYSGYLVNEDKDFEKFEHDDAVAYSRDPSIITIGRNVVILNQYTALRTTRLTRYNAVATLIRQRDLDWNWRVNVTSSDYSVLTPHPVVTEVNVFEGVNVPSAAATADAATISLPFGMTELAGVSHTYKLMVASDQTGGAMFTATIPIGQTSTTVPFSCPNDFLASGDHVVTLTAHAFRRDKAVRGRAVLEDIDYTDSHELTVLDSGLTSPSVGNPTYWTSNTGVLHTFNYEGGGAIESAAPAVASADAADPEIATVPDSSNSSQIRVHNVSGILRQDGNGDSTSEWVTGYLVFQGSTDSATLILGVARSRFINGGPISLDFDYNDFFNFVAQSHLYDYHMVSAFRDDASGVTNDTVTLYGVAGHGKNVLQFLGTMNVVDDMSTSKARLRSRYNWYWTRYASTRSFSAVVNDMTAELANRLQIRD